VGLPVRIRIANPDSGFAIDDIPPDSLRILLDFVERKLIRRSDSMVCFYNRNVGAILYPP
jgi:hypothetical protein